jgi:hypothetical protein
MKASIALFIVGLGTVSSVSADTETVKLLCNLDVTVHYPYGDPDKSQETDGVEMQSDAARDSPTGALELTSPSTTHPKLVVHAAMG